MPGRFKDFQPTDLIVVDGIAWKRVSEGDIETSGGRFRIWEDWTPDNEDLTLGSSPTRFQAPEAPLLLGRTDGQDDRSCSAATLA